MGNNPDWLPAGWKVSIRVRSCGRKDKYYINPSNGSKFNSKPHVLRYLKHGGKNHKHKEQNMVDKNNDVDIKMTVADKLPPGWIKEIRTKRKGGKTRRDPYYIDPISRRQFRSMQEVFRFLETMDMGHVDSKPDDKVRASEQLGDHSQSSSAGTNGKRSSKRLINKRGDKTITEHKRLKSEPELAAGSKGNAINYVDVPEDNLLEQRTKEDNSQAVELSDKIQLVNGVEECKDRKRENKNSSDIEVDKNIDGDDSLKSAAGSIGTGMENKAGDLPNKLPLVFGTEQHEGGTNQDKGLTANKAKGNIIEEQTLQPGLERFPMKIIYLPETNSLEQREKEDSMAKVLQHAPTQVNTKDENEARQYKRRKWNSKWKNALPRRSSKRLARAAVDSSLAVNSSNQSGTEARLLGEPEISPAAEEIGKAGAEARLMGEPEIIPTEEIKNHNSTKKHSTKCRRENQTNNKQDTVTLPLGELSCLDDYEGVGADSKNDEKNEKQIDSSLNNLLMDPCIEFAIKTLTGAIPIEGTNKVEDCKASSHPSSNEISGPSSILPSGDLWSDPCFEFAVRTLTGDIPMEGSSHSEISFEQPLSSSEASKYNSLTLSNFRFDNFCPTSYSYSYFNAAEKPTSRQMGIRVPPLPYNKNGSSRLC